MNVRELIDFGEKEIGEDKAKLLLASLLNVNKLDLILILDNQVNNEICSEYQKQINLVKKNIPIQYVIGNVNFYGNIFKVNEKVLIPRFETEELVENTINYINKYFKLPLKIIDLGCGSGAIGLSIKKMLANVDVTLLDISPFALEVSKDNAKNLDCDVEIIQSDMWDNVKDRYDIVVSNPPYIKLDEKIEDIVMKNEPHLALFGGIDGLKFYRKIRKDLLLHVNDKFMLALEIGDQEKDDVVKIFSDIENVKIITKKDLSERDRMVFVIRGIDIK